MRFDVKFQATEQSFTPSFGEVNNISDGSYERGYAAGYEEGNTDGLKALSGLLDESHKEVVDNAVTYLRKFALAFNATIESVCFENVQSTGEHVFYQCYQLKDINLPNLSTPGTYIFRDCTSLETLILPKVATMTYGICMGAKNLVRVDTSSITRINNAAFSSCAALSVLILRNNKVSILESVKSFEGTPIASGTGFVYVPDNLVEQYKAAANWITYASQIKPLSELEGDE